VEAATHDTQRQLAWEARHRGRAAIAAFLGSLGLIAFYITQQILNRNAPTSSGLEALTRVDEPGSVGSQPSLQTPFFEYVDAHSALLLAIGIGGLIGYLGIAWSVGFLGVVTRAREPMLRRWALYLPIIGGVLVGIGILASQVGSLLLVNSFLDGPRTVQAAREADNSVVPVAKLLYSIGTLTLAVGMVLVALNALRAGVLTRMFGYLGIIAGGLQLLVALPIVQIFWLAGLGVLFAGRWPGGELPAWRSGRAEPWPSGRTAAPPRKQQRRPATAPAAPRDPGGGGAQRRKRKKRH
jgi:hypothetical protein